MIETISNLKNNRLKSNNAASAIATEHVLRLKKTLGSLKSHSHATTEPLGISLKDIQSADRNGKWWLVGASWKNETKDADGEPDASRSKDDHPDEGMDQKDSEIDTEPGPVDLLSLAKQHRMNTDVRRAIFVAITSATDYKDAWLKLRRLSLNKSQRYEIPRVLVRCAGAEGAYNPYYRLIAWKLCGEHAYRVAFRFNLWGSFMRLGESNEEGEEAQDEDKGMELRELVNLAKMFGELIGTGSLPITVLKVLASLRYFCNHGLETISH
jgi:nucleolar MIF4G domain-containing protein 1